jgi:metallo-beta-lactamase family protein
MTLTFHGAARTVTGSKHLVTLANGKKILLDCGFFQGRGEETDGLNRHFAFDPSSIDILVLSHAHIDHSGNIPNLVKQGFRGKIYCTSATADLCKIMLADTAHIQESDAAFMNKRRAKKGQPKIKPIYNLKDVESALRLFIVSAMNTPTMLYDEVELKFTDAGHILGAAAINLRITENGKDTHITFTGDIGRSHDKILRAPAPFPQADYILCESTYGDRLHESNVESEQRLLEIVNRTCVENKGKLVIPAFSLGRTQEVVYALNNLSNQGKLPRIKVFVDSPLSVNATEIMKHHPEFFNSDILDVIKTDPDPFGFNGLSYIQDVNLSKQLNDYPEPCIIISASGMAEAGRIKHHIRNTISNPNNTILIAGYCTPQSLGGRLAAGQKNVYIFGDEFEVKASIETIHSFSAHADYKEMLDYLSCQDASKVSKVFLVHGEYPVQQEWRKKILAAGFKQVEIPEQGSVHIIN